MPLHFLNLKSFHPANKANQQKLYEAEEDYKQRKRREEEALKSFQREQELFAHRIQSEIEQKRNQSQIELMRKRKEKLAAQGIEENVNSVLESQAPSQSKRKNRKRGKKKSGVTHADNSLTATIEAAGNLFEYSAEGDVFSAAKPIKPEDLKHISSALPDELEQRDEQATEEIPQPAHDPIAALEEQAEKPETIDEKKNESDLLSFLHDDKQIAELLASVADDKELLDSLTPRERKLLLRKYKQIKKKLFSESSLLQEAEEVSAKKQRVI